ncbi:hypothetical protein ACLOJK_040330 [Asimina triloba]
MEIENVPVMLLRSASTPTLNSCISLWKESALEADLNPPIRRTGSITHLPRLVSVTASLKSSSPGRVQRTVQEIEHRDPSRPFAASKRKPPRKNPNRSKVLLIPVEEAKDKRSPSSSTASVGQLFSSSGLHEQVVDKRCRFADVGKEKAVPTLFPGDGIGSTGGAGIGGGGSDGGDGGGRDGDDGSGSWDSNNRNNSTDLYYQKMIEADPGNGLLLANYARFLKEVRGDLAKAEEYCGRAVLASPADGDVLSLYADLVWQIHKDSERAESYFNQAMQAAPDNCYVTAAYARFAWEADEDEEDAEEEKKGNGSSPPFFQEPAPHALKRECRDITRKGKEKESCCIVE